jgi:hypothetical protein
MNEYKPLPKHLQTEFSQLLHPTRIFTVSFTALKKWCHNTKTKKYNGTKPAQLPTNPDTVKEIYSQGAGR